MWPYLVAYQLGSTLQDDLRTRSLEALLKQRVMAMSGREVMERLWVVVADEGASDVLSQLSAGLGPDDQLVVLELAEDYASINVKSLSDTQHSAAEADDMVSVPRGRMA